MQAVFCVAGVRLLGHKWQMMVERVRRREMLLQRSAASHSLGVSQKASVQFGMTCQDMSRLGSRRIGREDS